MKIVIDENEKIVRLKNTTGYIYDKVTKGHLFITSEIMEYLKFAHDNELSIDEFVECFNDNSDKEYIKEVLNRLMKIGYIKNDLYDQYILDKTKNLKFNTIYLMLTNRCNLSCRHCSHSSSPSEQDTLSTIEIKKIIYNISSLKPDKVIFTGGEPLLRKDLEEILIYAKENLLHSKFYLSTNATLINSDNINLIRSFFDSVDISIDGVDEATCSKVRGKGVFNKVLKSINYLKINGIKSISLSMVLGENNFDLEEDFIKLNKQLSTTPIVRAFVPKGRGYENTEIFNESKHHLPASIKNLYNLSNAQVNSKKISSCSCNAFDGNIFIDSKGDVYPCPSLRKEIYKIMNLAYDNFSRDEIFSEISHTKTKFLNTLNYKNSKCEKCDLNIFCWNCPADFEDAKEYCEISLWCSWMKEKMNKIVWG